MKNIELHKMKNIFLLLLFPILSFGQIETSLKLKVGILQNMINKGEEGETTFWQTKGKITFGIVNYTEEQNPVFKELFINQFKELIPIFKKMNVSEDEKDTAEFVKIIIRQEEDFRNLLTKEQLEKYLKQLAEFEVNNSKANESYSSLFFSEKLLNLYKMSFK